MFTSLLTIKMVLLKYIFIAAISFVAVKAGCGGMNRCGYDCEEDGRGTCTVTGVHQESPTEVFPFYPSDNSSISSFKVERSRIESWNTDACAQFPNVKIINLSKNGIQTFGVDAFKTCKNLSEILDLTSNNIHTILLGTFEALQNLKQLLLNNNKLEFIDAKLFQGLKSLTNLNLDSNTLFEFDVQLVRADKLSSMELHLNDNNLLCDKFVNLVWPPGSLVSNAKVLTPRHRIVAPEKHGDFLCLSKWRWVDDFRNIKETVKENICKLVDEVYNLEFIVICTH